MRARSLLVATSVALAVSTVALADDGSVENGAADGSPLILLDHGPAALSTRRSWSPVEPEELTVAFTGDTLIHTSVSLAARQVDGYDFRPMFESVRHLIMRADLAICHLEVPLSPTSSGLTSYPRFNAPAEIARALVWAGYDGCSTASNHSIDKGVAGISGTLSVLEEAGLGQAGMAADPGGGWEAAMYQVDGIQIANISATYWLNGLAMPRDQEHLVQLLDIDQLMLVAARARGVGADLIVISMHCCTEYRMQPTPAQVETAHTLIESEFVDLVITHHSHIVGPVERVGGEFIIHGLGNFLSGMHSDPRTSDGLILFANAGKVNGRWRFTSIDVTPTNVTSWSWHIEQASPGSASFERTMSVLTGMGAPIGLYEGRGLSDWQLALIE